MTPDSSSHNNMILTLLMSILGLIAQYLNRIGARIQQSSSGRWSREVKRQATLRSMILTAAGGGLLAFTVPVAAATSGGEGGITDGLGDAVYNALLSFTDAIAKVILLPVTLTLEWIQFALITPVPPEAPGYGVSPGSTGVGPGSSLFTGTLGGIQDFFYQLSFIIISIYAVWYLIAFGIGKYPNADKGRILLMFAIAIGGVSVSQYVVGVLLEFLHVWTDVIFPSDTFNFTTGIFKDSFITVDDTAQTWQEDGAPAGIGSIIAGSVQGTTQLALFYSLGLLIFSIVAVIVGVALSVFLGARLISAYALYAAAPIFIVIYVFKSGPARVLTGPTDKFISTTTSLVLAVIPMTIVFRIGMELASAVASENLGGADILFSLVALSAGLWIGIKTSSTTARVANGLKTAALIAGAAVTAGAVGGSAGAIVKAGAYKGSAGAGYAAAGKAGGKIGDKLNEEGVPNPFSSSTAPDSTEEDAVEEAETGAAATPSPGTATSPATDDGSDQASATTDNDTDVIDLDESEYEEADDGDEETATAASDETTAAQTASFGPDDSRNVSDSVETSRSGTTTMTGGVSYSSPQPDGIGEMEVSPVSQGPASDDEEELDTEVIAMDEEVDETADEDEITATPTDEGVIADLGDDEGIYTSRSDGEIDQPTPDDELPEGEPDSVRIGYDPDTNQVLLRGNEDEMEDIRRSLNRVGINDPEIESISDDTLALDPETWSDQADDIYEQLWAVEGNDVGIESSAVGRLTEPAPIDGDVLNDDSPTPSATLVGTKQLKSRDIETAQRQAVATDNDELQQRLNNIEDQYLLETDDMPADIADEVTPASAVESQELGGVLLNDTELETTAESITDDRVNVSATGTLSDRFESISPSETQTMQANVGRVGNITTATQDERIEVRTTETGSVREIVATEPTDATRSVELQRTQTIEPVGDLSPEERFERIQQGEAVTAETKTKDTVTVDVTDVPESKQGQLRTILTEEIDGAEPIHPSTDSEAGSMEVIPQVDVDSKPGVSAEDVGKPFAFEVEQDDIDTVAQLLEVRGVDYQLDEFASQQVELPQEAMAKKRVEVPDTDTAVMRFVSEESQGVYATAAASSRGDTLTAGLNPTTGSLTIEGTSDGVSTEEFIEVVGPNVSDETVAAIQEGSQLPAVEIEQRDLAQDTIQRAIASTGVDINPDDARTLGLANSHTGDADTYQAQLDNVFPSGVATNTTQSDEAVVTVDGQHGVPEVRVEAATDMDGEYDVGVIDRDGEVDVAIPETETSEDVLKALGRDLFTGAPTTTTTPSGDTVITAQLDTARRDDSLDEVISRATQHGHIVKATKSAYESAGKDISNLQTQISVSDDDAVAVEFTDAATPQMMAKKRDKAIESTQATIEYLSESQDELEITLDEKVEVQQLKETIKEQRPDTREVDMSTSFGDDGTPTLRTAALPEEVLDAFRQHQLDAALENSVFESMGSVDKVSQTATTHDTDVSPHRADGWMLDPDR